MTSPFLPLWALACALFSGGVLAQPATAVVRTEQVRAELLAALEWYRAAGVDFAVGEDPVEGSAAHRRTSGRARAVTGRRRRTGRPRPP